MSGWDVGHISSANLGIRAVDDIDYAGQRFFPKDDAVNRFRTFLRNFQSSSGINFPYREQIRENITDKLYYITVDLDDISTYDNGILLPLLVDRPNDYLPLFEEAAKKVAFEQLGGDDGNQSIIDGLNDNIRIQILLKNYNKFTELRSLSANNVSKLISIRGIIISASRSRIKATALTIMCKNCKMQKIIQCPNGFGGARLPRECDNRPQAAVNGAMGQQSIKCPLDPFIIIADQSHYIDQQRLKLQEAPESIPTGEMPRTLSLALERQLVGTIKPGARVIAIGMYTTYEAASAAEKNKTGANDVGIRIPYIRVFGIENESEAGDIMIGKFTPEEEQQMEQLSQTPNLYEKIWTSIAPAIFDSEDTKNIKKSIALQLFGGTRKHLPDGMRLRGDINILLLGDPSVAKSQFLKFAHQVAPIGVYTSGKGASAAGLTASVIRDPSSGEFHLEGGALVLGDGGLVCIDEFDKMREQDRVAIHEAMEQQTISIAKAGITTILNSRTSVLAAANPIFGRYDDMRSPTENIDFQTSILSRFDLIFIVRDIQDEARDTKLAKYVIKVHKERDNAVKEDKKDIGMIDIPLLKKYIAFARQRCSPRLSEEAAALLKSQYVQFRDTFGKQREQNADGAPSAIPITVRQLEAIIRLSESMARLELSPIATSVHVQEAIRLFQVSTYRAATSSFHESGIASAEFDRNVKLAETEILNRVALHAKINVAQIKAHLMARNHDPIGMGKAMDNLVKKGQLIYMNQGKMIERRA